MTERCAEWLNDTILTMVEKVARHIFSANTGTDYYGVYHPAFEHEQSHWETLARAAIEALREPTEAMLEEGPGEPYMEKHVWARMIDAALKEHERKPE